MCPCLASNVFMAVLFKFTISQLPPQTDVEYLSVVCKCCIVNSEARVAAAVVPGPEADKVKRVTILCNSSQN